MKERQLRRMQQVGNLGSIAGNFGIINPLVFNQFGYGTYAQVGQLTRHWAILPDQVNSRDTGLFFQITGHSRDTGLI